MKGNKRIIVFSGVAASFNFLMNSNERVFVTSRALDIREQGYSRCRSELIAT